VLLYDSPVSGNREAELAATPFLAGESYTAFAPSSSSRGIAPVR
jgi:hypothetical protein